MRHGLEEMSERFETVQGFLEEETEAGGLSSEIQDRVSCVLGVEFSYHTYVEILMMIASSDELVVGLVNSTGIEQGLLFADYLNAKSKL